MERIYPSMVEYMTKNRQIFYLHGAYPSQHGRIYDEKQSNILPAWSVSIIGNKTERRRNFEQLCRILGAEKNKNTQKRM